MSQRLGQGFKRGGITASNVVAALAIDSPAKKDRYTIITRDAQGFIRFTHAHIVEYTNGDDFQITVEAERVSFNTFSKDGTLSLKTKRTAHIPRRFLLGLGRESVYGYNPDDYEDEDDGEEWI